MREVAGKVAFVTGGASGIGPAMARSFTAAGMRVAIADIEEDALERAAASFAPNNTEVIALRVDVTDRESMARAADDTQQPMDLTAYEGLLDGMLDPAIVGDMTLHAIQQNEAYIFTHPELARGVSGRLADIQASMDRWRQYRERRGLQTSGPTEHQAGLVGGNTWRPVMATGSMASDPSAPSWFRAAAREPHGTPC